MSHLFEINQVWFGFAWIILSTGLPPSRLERLRVRTDGPTMKDGAGIVYDPLTNILSYLVENGATVFDTSIGFSRIQLLLPDFISRIIGTNQHPFRDILQEIDNDIRVYRNHHPGVTPVPERLAASYYVLFSEQDFTSLEAAVISGSIPGRLKAQARYYRFEIRQLNQTFQSAHQAFIKRIIDLSCCADNLKKLLYNARFQGDIPNGSVGSQVARPPSEYKGFFQKLNSAFDLESILLSTERSSERIDHLINAINLQSLNLYMMLQINTCIRPIGEATKLAISTDRLCAIVIDKASARFTERRITPLNCIVTRQIEACKVAINVLCSLEGGALYNFDSLPVLVNKNRSGQLIIKRMRGKDFRKTSEELGIGAFLPERNNGWRHIMATHLNRKVRMPFSAINLMG